MTDDTSTEQTLADWNERLSTALGVPPADIDEVLGLAGVVAHSVVRPAAPLSTYLVGYAAAQLAATGLSPQDAFAQALAIAQQLAVSQQPAQTEPGE